MHMRTIFTCLTLIVLMASLGLSQYLVRESFEYPQSDSLNGAGTVTNGFGGPWVLDDGATKYSPTYVDTMFSAVIGQTALPYGDLMYPITNVGNHITYSAPGDWKGGGRFYRPLDKTWPNTAGKTYWASFIMDAEGLVPVAGYSQWEYYCVKLFEGTSERLAIGKAGHSTTYTCGSGWAGDNDPGVSLVDFAHGPVWLVTEIFMNGDTSAATPTKVFMWVNPDPTASAPDTLYADVKNTFTIHQGFNRVAIEIGSGDTLAMNFDEIRLGESWASVSSPQYAVRESFEYPQSDSLNGAGTVTNGFGGPWVLDDGATKYSPTYVDTMFSAVIGQTALPYGDLMYPITNVGNHITYSAPGDWKGGGRFYRPLDKTWPNTAGKTYWASFIMDAEGLVPVAGYSQWEYYCVKLFEGTSERLAIGKAGHSTTYTCGSGWAGDNRSWDLLVDFAHGPVWLVTEIFMNGDTSAATPTKVFMWVNPDPTASAPDTLYADVKNTFTIHQGFNRVAIEIGSGDTLAMNFDEIRLGTDWTSVSLPLAITGVAREIVGNRPSQFDLLQNYPNPFNPNTVISYSLKKADNVKLSVYDILGREVAVLVNSIQTAGLHQVVFSGTHLSSGVYFYRLESAGTSMIKKMLLLK